MPRRMPRLSAALFVPGVTAMLLGAAVVLPSTARSQPVSAQPAAASATPNERLMALVPKTAGAWTLHALSGARTGPDGQTTPGAHAEFRKGSARITLTVTDAGPGQVIAPPATPTERNTGSGIEKVYAEDRATVHESHRKADGRIELMLARADGIVVTVTGTNVPAVELKQIAMGVKAR